MLNPLASIEPGPMARLRICPRQHHYNDAQLFSSSADKHARNYSPPLPCEEECFFCPLLFFEGKIKITARVGSFSTWFLLDRIIRTCNNKI